MSIAIYQGNFILTALISLFIAPLNTYKCFLNTLNITYKCVIILFFGIINFYKVSLQHCLIKLLLH